MVSDRAFIFHICIPWGKALSLVPKSRSSVKVKYQGHSFQNNGRCGGIGLSQIRLDPIDLWALCPLRVSLLLLLFEYLLLE